MKKYRENEIREHNFFYVGGAMKRKKHAQGKPGTSRQQDVRKRFARIRTDEKDFAPIGYIDIFNITKARLEALEHEVKATLTDMGFKNTGNDHFEFEINKQLGVKGSYQAFAVIALKLAVDYCKAHKLKYKYTWYA